VVPPVHVSAGNSIIAAAAATENGQQVLVMGCSSVSKQTGVPADHGPVEVTSVSVIDGGHTEESFTHVVDDSYDGWSKVKSAKSPRRRKTNSAEFVESQQVINC